MASKFTDHNDMKPTTPGSGSLIGGLIDWFRDFDATHVRLHRASQIHRPIADQGKHDEMMVRNMHRDFQDAFKMRLQTKTSLNGTYIGCVDIETRINHSGDRIIGE